MTGEETIPLSQCGLKHDVSSMENDVIGQPKGQKFMAPKGLIPRRVQAVIGYQHCLRNQTIIDCLDSNLPGHELPEKQDKENVSMEHTSWPNVKTFYTLFYTLFALLSTLFTEILLYLHVVKAPWLHFLFFSSF